MQQSFTYKCFHHLLISKYVLCKGFYDDFSTKKHQPSTKGSDPMTLEIALPPLIIIHCATASG